MYTIKKNQNILGKAAKLEYLHIWLFVLYYFERHLQVVY